MSYSDIKKKHFGDSSPAKKGGNSTSAGYDAIANKHGMGVTVDESYINRFVTESNTLFQNIQKEYQNLGFSTAESMFQSYGSKVSSLNSMRNRISKWVTDNRASIDDKAYQSLMGLIDSYDKSSSSIMGALGSARNYYSQFSSEEEAEESKIGWLRDNAEFTDEAVSARKNHYQSNLDRIAEIEETLQANATSATDGMSFFEKLGYWLGGAQDTTLPTFSTTPFNKPTEESDALLAEKQALEAENTQYERLQKVLDDYYVTETPEFIANSAYRNYSNATRQELDAYDISVQEGSLALSNGGQYDQYGNILDREGNIVTSAEAPVVSDKLGWFLSLSDDEIVEAYNRLSASNGNYTITWANIAQEGDVNGWKYLTDREINIYYNLMKTQGQEAAYKFLEDMETVLTRRETQANTEYINNEAGALEIIALNAASIPMSVFGGIIGAVSDVGDLVQGKDINPYSRAHSFTNIAGDVRNKTATEIDEFTGGLALPWVDFSLGDAYQAGMSFADSALAMAIPVVGEALLATSAATSEMKDLYERGASQDQIFAGGLLAGAAEAVFEHISIGELRKLKDMDQKAVKNFFDGFVRTTIMGGVEASEEMMTEVANTLTDALVMGSQSDWEDMETFVKNVVNAGIGGFISGGVGGAGASISNNIQYNDYVREQGQGILDLGGGDTLAQLAMDMAAEESGLSSKSLQKLAGKVGTASESKKAGIVGRLSERMGATVSKKNASDIETALTKNGVSKKTASRIAAYLTDSSELSQKQEAEIEAEIEGSEEIRNAIASVIDDPSSDFNKRSADLLAARLGIRNQTISSETTKTGEVDVLNEVDVTDKVSESGKTTQVSTGETITIDKNNAIAKNEMVGGKIVTYLNTDKGVVKASDVSYASEAEGLLYESFVDMNPAFANAVIKNYDGTTPIQTYIRGMREGITLYGMHNFQAVGVDISEDTFLADLPKADQDFALKLGRAYAKTRAKKAETAIRTDNKGAKGKHTKGSVRFENGAKPKSHAQRQAVALARHLSAAMGIDIVFYDATIEGTKVRDANGYYDPKTGTIHLDLQNAKSDAKTIAFTLSHELVHHIKQWSPAKFNTFANFLMEQYAAHGVSTSQLLANKMAELGTDDADLAYEEMIADACQTLLLDSNAVEKLTELAHKDRSLVQKILDFIKDLLNKIRAYYKEMAFTPRNAEAQALLKMQDVMEQIHGMFEDALVAATQNYQASKELDTEAASMSEDGTIRLQMKQYQQTGRATLLRYLEEQYGESNANDLIATIDNIYSVMAEIREDTALSVFGNWQETDVELDAEGRPILTTSINNGDYELNQDFSRVCKKRRQLNFVLNMLAEDPAFEASHLTKDDFVKINKAIKEHGFEIACALCFVDSKRYRQAEWADSFASTWNDILRSVMVEGSKPTPFNFATKSVNLTDEGISIDTSKPVSYRKWSDGKATETRTYSSLDDLLENDGNVNVKTIARLIRDNPSLRHEFRGADIIASDGFDTIQRLAPEVRAILDGWGGSSVPKPSSNDAIYDNSVLNIAGYNAEKAFSVGGVRMNSFSDFMAHMFFDYAQAFADLSAKKLPMHSYTKELDFARLFGLTGGKINMSAIAAIRSGATDLSKIKGAANKKAATDFEKSVAGLDISRLAEKLGKDDNSITYDDVIENLDDVDYVWADESIDVKSATLLQTGILYDRLTNAQASYCYELIRNGQIEEAFRVAGEENVNRGYAKHLGIITVGVSKAHIVKLLRDPTIRMVIPYHKSGLNPAVAKAMNIAFYDDFTDVQNTSVKKKGETTGISSKSSKVKGKSLQDFSFYDYFGKTIDGVFYDGKATAAKYLDWCKNGVYDETVGDYVYYFTGGGYILASELHAMGVEVIPKFNDFSSEENYYKLIEDFDCYDTITGEHSSQEAVDLFHDGLPSDYKDVLVRALKAEQKVSDDFKEHLDHKGLRDEIMGIVSKRGYKPSDSGIMKQLKKVDPVEPTSDKWSRTHTTEEAKAAYPKLWDVSADESETRNPTQISQTVNTYRKIFDYLKAEGFDGTILDASSGLGFGTKAGIEEYGFDVEDIEPYPDKDYKPKYTDYSKLRKKYDVIISSFVLNVVPQDQRDALVVRMGELLKDGGRMFVNVRSRDVESLAKTGKNIHLGNMEWIETARGSYQKGFTKPELVAYLQDALGDGFTVTPTSLQSSVAAIVTKKKPDYSYQAFVSKPDMVLTTVGGNVPSNRADIVSEAKKNAAQVGAFNPEDGSVSVHVDDIDTDVIVTKKSLVHGLDRRMSVQAPVLVKVGEVLKNSIRINEMTPRATDVKSAYILIGAALGQDGSLYVASFVVNKYSNEVAEIDVLYSANAKKESAAFLPKITGNPATPTNSVISISQLLDFVNRYFPDILPESVLRHFGHTSRPDGELGNSVLYQKKRTPSEYAPVFYSQMQRLVEGIKMDKIGASSVVNFLKGKGVRHDEIKWSGIEAFLEGKKSVTKQELLDFLAGSQLEIQEQMSNGTTLELEDGTVYHSADEFKNAAYAIADEKGIERSRVGFENIDDEAYIALVDGDEESTLLEATINEGNDRWSEYKLDGGENYREIVFVMPNSSYSNRAMRVHWGDDAEGVLAHARVQDLTTADGKKMLFVEEIQSDWHNAGHESGYLEGDSDAIRKEADALLKRVKSEKKSLVADLSRLLEGKVDNPEAAADSFVDYQGHTSESFMLTYLKRFGIEDQSIVERISAYTRLKDDHARLRRIANAGADGLVPDAPFRDTYHEYVMKRLIRMAAEGGYDLIGWTTADIQSKRWSDEYAEGYRIEYDQDIPKFLRKYGKRWGATVGQTELPMLNHRVTMYDVNREQEYASFMEWSDVVYGELKAQGMSIPKLAKVKFEKRDGFWIAYDTETGREYDRAKIRESSDTVWSMDITDSMQESVLYEGQPMFQKKEVSNRTILANALESTIDTSTQQGQSELQSLRKYQGIVGQVEALEAHLAEVNAEIRELSFGKGARDTARIRALQTDKQQTMNRIHTYDRQLLRLEAMSPIQSVLQHEKELVRKRTEQKGKEAIAAVRERAAKTQRELLDRVQESRRKGVEGRRKTELRHKIRDVVADLNKLLLRPTKDKHIKEGLRKVVAEALSAINMDTTGADERVAHYNKLIAKAKDPDVIEALTKSRDRIQLQGDNLKAKLDALRLAYEKIKDSEDIELMMSYQEVIKNSIKNLSDKVGNTSIRNMTLEQLEMVYDLVTMIRKTIRNANKLFKEQKGKTIMQTAEAVNDEVRRVGGEHYKQSIVVSAIKKAGWSLLKPYVAFRTIGSDTLTDLYRNLRAGEDTFYEDVSAAQAFIEAQYEKHGFKSWDMKETKEFTAKSGKTFKLTLEQMMTLYAYSRREQAIAHILEGGIVFEDAFIVEKNKLGVPVKYEVTTKSAFNLSEEILNEIANSLTAEQKAFVEEMQAYLSDTMGTKGNEVSMELLGVKLFKEKFYLPLKSSQFYMNFKPEEAGEVKLKSPAFSKETVPHANNPVVIHNFTDLWAEHISNMSMYHAFVLALEDFTRVYNYKTKTDDKVETMSTKETIANAYGTGATEYIRNFLVSLNGGVRMETVGYAEALTSLAKKGAVLGSASVAIQQPSAVMRAMAYIDPKYFVVSAPKSMNLLKHKTDWEELKKYAPIAGIKEMGRFDIGMGKGSADWIKSQKTVIDKVEDVLSVAPAFMDEVTWLTIWNAVKRETLSKHKNLSPKSEEFLKIAGERFTEVISLSQVYDSVFSRSDIMRNKSWIAKALTAFMAEPTTTLNMMWDSWVQAKRSGSKAKFAKITARTTGAVLASIVFNSALKSIILAMRDDDEDESYAEKYLENFFGDLKDSLNPLALIPYVKDIVSIFRGYDVERMDVAIISDLKNAIDAFDSDTKTDYEKWSGLVGAVSALFGIPVKNVERDIRAFINTSFGETEGTTSAGLMNAILEGWTGESKSNGQQLYEAMLNGDREQIERVKARFKNQTAINSAIRKALRDNDPRIKEAAQAIVNEDYDKYTRIANSIINEGHFSETNVVAAIKSEVNALTKDEEETTESTVDKEVSLYEMDYFVSAAVSGDTIMAQAIREDIIRTAVANGKDREDAEKSFNSSFQSRIRDEYEGGSLSDREAVNMLVSYGGKTEEEASSKVQYWEFKKSNPDTYVSEYWIDAYNEDVASSGVSLEMFIDYKNAVKDIEGDGSKARKMQVIDSLPISNAQKDALYFAEGWASSKLWEAPWR